MTAMMLTKAGGLDACTGGTILQIPVHCRASLAFIALSQEWCQILTDKVKISLATLTNAIHFLVRTTINRVCPFCE